MLYKFLDSKNRFLYLFLFIFSFFILFIIGLFLIYSASYKELGYLKVIKQFLFFFIAVVFSIFSLKLEFKAFDVLSNFLYYITLFLLLFVLIKGHTALGATRWIALGPITFQPSEFAKLTLIIYLAVNLSKLKDNLYSLDLLKILAYTFLMMVVIMKQPDLGTSLVFGFILYIELFVLGFNPYILVSSVILFSVLIFPFLKEYQIKRLTIFLNPYSDPVGAGWNIIQSLIAVGSGYIFGLGYLKGLQTQLKFVPEHSTDFVFTVLAEEFGFVGVIFVLFLYFVLLIIILKVIKEEEDLFYRLLALGVFSMMFFHILVNIGMNIGIMPVTGVPLPFLSYGGTAIFVNTFAVFLIIKILIKEGEVYE